MPLNKSAEMRAPWPEKVRGRAAGFRRVTTAIVCSMAVAAIVGVVLPSRIFRARAVVSVVDARSPLSVVLPPVAADAVVSEPVMRRAAESLIGTSVSAPAPDLMERLAVGLGLGGVRPTGQAARLATDLARSVVAKPGDAPGTLDVSAASPDGQHAAQIADAVAEALISEHDKEGVQARRARDLDASARLERFKADAAAAHRRLASLGGVDADPQQIRAAAATQTAMAKARVDAIHAIIASGSPPLSDRRDVPSGIETMQNSYLDLSRQLAKARETLGDRHTTIIALRESVHRAAASLTAEWARLARLADAELAAARQREAMLRKPETPTEAHRREAIDEARRAVQVADDSVARAQAARQEAMPEEGSYQLLAHAAVPTSPAGFSNLARALMAALAGLLVLVVALRWPLRRPVPAQTHGHEDWDRAATLQDSAAAESTAAAGPIRQEKEATMRSHLDGETEDASLDEDLMRSLSAVLPSFVDAAPQFGAVPTVMVAANEADTGTMTAALALGRTAVSEGYRVLVVEAAQSRSHLAGAVDADEDPVLIDLFGTLRVALHAEATDGCLYLAPHFEQGGRLASNLARQSDIPLVDDLAADFDLIVIDGGRTADAAAAGWGAEAYIRVGRAPSRREDEQFAASFGVPTSAIVGTVVDSVLVKAAGPLQRSSAGLGAALARSGSKAVAQRSAQSPRPAYPRSVILRRKAGGR